MTACRLKSTKNRSIYGLVSYDKNEIVIPGEINRRRSLQWTTKLPLFHYRQLCQLTYVTLSGLTLLTVCQHAPLRPTCRVNETNPYSGAISDSICLKKSAVVYNRSLSSFQKEPTICMKMPNILNTMKKNVIVITLHCRESVSANLRIVLTIVEYSFWEDRISQKIGKCFSSLYLRLISWHEVLISNALPWQPGRSTFVQTSASAKNWLSEVKYQVLSTQRKTG